MDFFPIHLSSNRPDGLSKKVRTHLLIAGRVQGVFFRDSAKKMAQKLEVFGQIKNLREGNVEIVLEGDQKKVEKMKNWAKRGPILSKVKSFKETKEEYKGEYNSFEIKYEL